MSEELELLSALKDLLAVIARPDVYLQMDPSADKAWRAAIGAARAAIGKHDRVNYRPNAEGRIRNE
jgi:hypothetical protein